MVKNKGPSYTAQMKSKVHYPKMKSAQKKDMKVESPPSVTESPSMIRKETVVLSKATPAAVEIIQKDDERECSPTPDKPNVEKKSSSLSRKDTIVIQRNVSKEEPGFENICEPEASKAKQDKKPPTPPSSNPSSIPSRDDIIQLVRTEPIFESLDHRKAILELVSDYAKNVWRGQILETLNHPVFDEIDNLEEVSLLLNEFVASKLNNNQ